jgi:glycosyltransferase involved in cell wall biosynthesis
VLKLIHTLWKKIPYRLRRKALFSVASRFAPRALPLTGPPENPVLIAGLLCTATGIGESARLCYDALTALGYDTRGIDLSGGILMQEPNVSEFTFRDGRSLNHSGTIIVHVNPPVLSLALLSMWYYLDSGMRVIGYWAWELPVVPEDWMPCLRLVHEIWVPSSFTALALRSVTDLPIHVVPHPVRIPKSPPSECITYDLSSDAFVVLTMFDMSSGFERKNPIAAIKAFREAFGDDPECLLVIKVSEADNYPRGMLQIREAVGDARNVSIVTETLSHSERWALIKRANVVLSLHRSEGFGLVLAEAMLLGKPVVATGWSGNMDFMNHNNSVPVLWKPVPPTDPQFRYHVPDVTWAEPSIKDAAQNLVKLKLDKQFYQRVAEAAYSDSQNRFSLDAYRRVIAPLLPQ